MNKIGERCFSVFLLIVCAVFLIESRNISTFTLPGTPGPRIFPLAIIGLLIFLVILHELLSFRRSILAKKRDSVFTENSPDKSQDEYKLEIKKVVISFIILFLYILGINYIGFYISTLLVVFVVLKLIFEFQSCFRIIIITALISVAIYLIFALLFSMRLPRGVLGLL